MPTFIFFGTGHFAEEVLKNLISRGYKPAYVITAPDKPVGRHQVITPPPVKCIADAENIPVIQPESLKNVSILAELKAIIEKVDVCVVADYGKILPQALLDLCPLGFLNIHPSLLPLHRGPAPLQATILAGDAHTGISIIKIDALMDHGPLVAVEKVLVPEFMWPCPVRELSDYMAKRSAQLLSDILPDYVAGKLPGTEQNHEAATYTKMIEKKDGEVSWDDIVAGNLKDIYLKFCAYKEWPEVFFIHDGKRVKIKVMGYWEGTYAIERVTPEGKTEISWTDYIKHHKLEK
ncbi:MAG: methionyl-tRNA formyltransferase [Patescibacteria group bacterium]